MIKVGVIGTGFIGRVHLEALARLGGVKVVTVTDTNKDLARESADQFGIPNVAADSDEIINDPEIDVIHNCTPNKYHFDITKKALLAGKQVLSEKPLSMSLKEAEELVYLAAKKKAVTGVNFCYRYYPVVQEMAARFRKKDPGEVRVVTGTWFQDWLSKETDYSWRLEKSESGSSNITADLGSHGFDLVQFVTGLKVSEVMGDMRTVIPIRKKPKGQVLAFEKSADSAFEEVKMELEEYSAILFRLSNDSSGSFTTSQVCNGRKSDTEFQIYSEKYSLAWNHNRSNELWIGHRDKPNETLIESPLLQQEESQKYATLPAGHPLGYNDAVLNLFKDYYDAVKNKSNDDGSDRPTFKTGYDEMKILDAIMKSVDERTWVSIK